MKQEKGLWKVITASSAGTLIEWYDFYIFGALSTIIAQKFFPDTDPTAALLSTLATFAAGFIVRPFGAIVFGRLGDIVGRKYTFLLTLILMGGATFMIGLVPSFEEIGYWAPAMVLMLRLLQGLALGGEYGGAATYVAEHAPQSKRGFYTSWIQTTATLGLFLSLGVILTVRNIVGEAEFTQGFGWRIPFLLSIILVIISIFIRLKMKESPLFAKLKATGGVSRNPLKESFGRKENFKLVLLALFGATMGQGVIWYTSQFYVQNFILTRCLLEYQQANTIILIALALATPFFILFGKLSDKLGRRNIILAGMLLGVLLYQPFFKAIYNTAEVEIGNEVVSKTEENPVRVNDNVTAYVSRHILSDGSSIKETRTVTMESGQETEKVKKEILLNTGRKWKIIAIIFIMVIFVTMVYGPIAAFLVEMFPVRIRYTSMSLPYHIGNGVFGGMVPFIALLITTIPGTDIFSGLWYPIGIAALSFIIGALYLPNDKPKKERI